MTTAARRTYGDLLSDDPAWPALEKAARASAHTVEILPPENDEARRRCLEAVQVTTRSTLGALAHETGGILVDGGWVRVLGSGHPRLPRSLGTRNEQLGVPLTHHLLVADDAVGGVFAINAGALGPSPGRVYYFAPDSLGWEDTGHGHTSWMHWLLSGNVADYYASLRWPTWREDVATLRGDQAFHLHPPPFTSEGRDPSKVSRRAVPLDELHAFYQSCLTPLGPPS